MKKKRGQNFLTGSLILLCGNILVKIIGAFYKIPMTNLIGKQAMGYFNAAYTLFDILLVIATAGLPLAVCKMVSKSNAVGHKREVRKILKISLFFFTVIGLVAAFIMFFGASFLAGVAKIEGAAPAISVFAPAIFFLSITSAFRGFFQGHLDMMPTAASQVAEASVKLVVGLGLAAFAVSCGWSLSWVAAAAIGGVTVSTAIGTFVLMSIFLVRSKKGEFDDEAGNIECDSSAKIAFKLIAIAIPFTIGASIVRLTNQIDLFLITNILKSSVGLAAEVAEEQYGIYTSMSLQMFTLPIDLLRTLSITALPAMTAAFAAGAMKKAGATLTSVIRVLMIFAIPASIGLSTLSSPILSLLFVDETGYQIPLAASMLSILGIAVMFVSVSTVTGTVFQACGHEYWPVYTMLAGSCVKVIVNCTLISNPAIGIKGAPIGTLCCYIVITTLNFILMKKVLGKIPNVFRLCWKPVLSAVAMAIAAYFVQDIFYPILGKAAILLTLAVAVTVYFVFAALFRAFVKQDLLLLPKGEKIVGKFARFNILSENQEL